MKSLSRNTLTIGFLAVVGLAAIAAAFGHPITNFVPHDVLASLGALGAIPFAGEVKTIASQIGDLENTRAAKSARAQAVLQKAMDEGRSSDAAEQEEFDLLDTEIKAIDADLVRMKRLSELQAQATPVIDQTKSGNGGRGEGSGQRAAHIVVKSADKEEAFKGQNYVRQVIAKAYARLEQRSALSVAIERWGKTNPTLVAIMKANEVPGGGTGAGEWGAELVTADGRYRGDFIEYLYSQTVYDKLPLRQIPAHVTIKGQDGQGTAYWVGESKAIPPTVLDFMNVTLTPLKVAALAVMSNDLLRYSDPSAEMLVRDALVNASSQRVDTTFLGAAAAVAGVSPAGLLNGVAAINASGTDADALRRDVKALYAPFIAAKNATNLVFVTTPSLAKSIQLMQNPLGQPEFGQITTSGGTLLGDPVYTGDNVGTGDLILLKPSDIYRIGDTGVEVAVSSEAMIEQNSVPTGATDTPVAASATMTSMFQEDSSAIRVVRHISFAKRRASAVQYIGDADYGADAT